MTTIVLIETECSLCGTTSEQQIARVPTTEGLPDLDSRPSEQMRSSIVLWVQRCPKCGYCATDISLEYPLADQTVHSPAYQKVLRKRGMPEKARQFLAWALIQEANEEFGGAGWAAMHAAWICDDAEKQKAAKACRLLVLERFARQRARLGHITGFRRTGRRGAGPGEPVPAAAQGSTMARRAGWTRISRARPAEVIHSAIGNGIQPGPAKEQRRSLVGRAFTFAIHCVCLGGKAPKTNTNNSELKGKI